MEIWREGNTKIGFTAVKFRKMGCRKIRIDYGADKTFSILIGKSEPMGHGEWLIRSKDGVYFR